MISKNLFVVDTNILLSAMFFAGRIPSLVVDRAIVQGQLVFTSATSAELLRVCMNPKFEKYLSEKDRLATVVAYLSASYHTLPEIFHTLCRDPHDDMFLDAAVSSGARYIITGDEDLLVLGSIGTTKIITARGFLEQKI